MPKRPAPVPCSNPSCPFGRNGKVKTANYSMDGQRYCSGCSSAVYAEHELDWARCDECMEFYRSARPACPRCGCSVRCEQ